MGERHAGSRVLLIADEKTGVTFPSWVLYPTVAAPSAVSFGPYTVEVGPNAPVDGRELPIVIVSHGSGSSHLLFRTLALHLARNGYVVALPEHPGNNRNDNTLADAPENLVNRPRHVQLTLSAICNDPSLGPRVRPERAAIIGHSLGAYTALAVAGGTPWDRTGRRIDVTADERVKSLVLMAPAAFCFVPEHALSRVAAPMLVYAGEEDTITPPWHAHLIRAQVPDKSQVMVHLVARAGHYSFLSPFPPAMRSPSLRPSIDPEGFDRERFHARLEAEVLAFLEQTLQ